MKKQFAVLIGVAFASVSMMQAQDSSSQGTTEPSEGVQIEEPSGADPAVPPATTDPLLDPAGAGGAPQSQPQTTVTVSQTFTNSTNSITIIGTVDRAEDKQTVEQSLRQVLPGKQINNQLKVASQEGQITEPSGADRPGEEEKSQESELENIAPQSQPELDRQFNAEGENRSQP